MTLFHHFQPISTDEIGEITSSKIFKKFLSCLFQILKLQDATFRSLFHTLLFEVV